jgi:hypothetical protein
MIDVQLRKYRYQNGLGTRVVCTVNYVHQDLENISDLKAIAKVDHLATTTARLKVKEIGGDESGGRNMRFNASIRAKPYQC